jgi:hypothetical protein
MMNMPAGGFEMKHTLGGATRLSFLVGFLLVSCGGNGGSQNGDTATIELTGQKKESIHLTLGADPLYAPGSQFLLRYSNDEGQSLMLQGPARQGTYGTHTGGGGALLQMQVTPGAPGFSHNAFADECQVTVEQADQKAIGGRFTCDFGETQATGTFSASF